MALLGVIAALYLITQVVGLRLNWTGSAERGFYARAPWLPLDRGQLVYACTPAHTWSLASRYGHPSAIGFCPADQLSVIKRIAAIPGDRVTLSARGVTVNGHVLPGSAPRAFDSAGRALPAGDRDLLLGPGEYWITSARPVPAGLDSRYLGPFSRADIIDPAQLLWRIST